MQGSRLVGFVIAPITAHDLPEEPLNYFAFNFIKIHSTLRVTPSMAAGVTTRP